MSRRKSLVHAVSPPDYREYGLVPRTKARMQQAAPRAPAPEAGLLVGTIYDENGEYHIRPDNYVSQEEHLRRLKLHHLNSCQRVLDRALTAPAAERGAPQCREQIAYLKQKVAALENNKMLVHFDEHHQTLLPDPALYTREQWDKLTPGTRIISLVEYDQFDRAYSFEIRGHPIDLYPTGYNNVRPPHREDLIDRVERGDLFRREPSRIEIIN
jgi:hypothetical protein